MTDERRSRSWTARATAAGRLLALALLVTTTTATALVGGAGSAGARPAAPQSPTPQEAFIIGLYRTVFGAGHPPDSAGLAYWSAQLDLGRPATAVADHIADTARAHALFVTETYLADLGRTPDPLGLAHHRAGLDAGRDALSVTADVLASREDFARHGPRVNLYLDSLTLALLGTGTIPGSAHEVQAWLDRLGDGTDAARRRRTVVALATTNQATRRAVHVAVGRACAPDFRWSAAEDTSLRAQWHAVGGNPLRLAAFAYVVVCPSYTAPA